ncbi:tubulin alpha chain, partial [Reticulomyxa filosa]
VFFEETGSGQFVTRNLAVKCSIDESFFRGTYNSPEKIVNDRLRKFVENCDNVMCFVIGHSVGGGTGSELGALSLERLAVDYRKKPKIGFEIYPSPNLCTCVVESYNALLAMHWLLDHTKVSLLLDNEAIYGICQKQLRIAKPDVDNLNKLISKIISAMTASLRFSGELN